MAAMQVTLENIALSKLLNYVPKQTLVDFISPKKYTEVEHRLRQQLDKSKITLKDMKQHLATSPSVHSILAQSPDRSRRVQQVPAGCRETAWNGPRQSGGSQKGHDRADTEIQGLSSITIATCRLRTLPGQLHDDEQFQNIGLVPTALKQRVYDKGDIATRGLLQETLTRKINTISDIPSGYRQFISKNPDKFKDYFEQKRHELGLLKSVLHNLSSDDKRKMQAYYIQNKTIEPEKFSDIIASFHADASLAKRPRAEQPVKKGGRFNLEDRLYNQDTFYDGTDSSVDDVLDFD
jgi:hypothetical protein